MYTELVDYARKQYVLEKENIIEIKEEQNYSTKEDTYVYP